MQPTNTIIVTDPQFLKAGNDDILDEFIATVQNLVPERIQVSRLKTFGRLVLVFGSLDSAINVYEILQKQQIKCNYSIKDNAYEEEDATGFELAESPTTENAHRFHLSPPERKVELQSPPPSPYLNYVQKPEDPPDEITMTDPESFSHILYQPTLDNSDKERVFAEVGLNELVLDEDIPILVVDREEAQVLKTASPKLH